MFDNKEKTIERIDGMRTNFLNVGGLIETPLIFIDKDYQIKDYNKAAKKIICKNTSILEILNDVYWPILKNGVTNNFPFSISEKIRLKKSVLNTTNDSYKLVVKPIGDDYFVVEFIRTGALNVTNKLLINKNKDFVKHSSILSELISMKSGQKELANMSSDEIIKTYEEQLKLQFAIDNSVNKTIAPIVAGDLSIEEAAKLVLSELKNIIPSEDGFIVTKLEKDYKIIEKFDDEIVLKNVDDLDTFFDNLISIDKPSYYNDVLEVPNKIDLSNILTKIDNIMIIPLMVEGVDFGFIVMAGCETQFTQMHLKIANRLGQLFSLAIQRSEYLLTLKRHADIDIMTGCCNRRSGLATLHRIYNESNMSKEPFSLIFFDINNLKRVNDKLGHDFGDDLIKDFVKIIKGITRQEEIFARYGGDEFILILPNCCIKSAQGLIRRIENSIKAFNEENNKKYEVSVSFGFVEYNEDCTLSVNELIAYADSLMYENKKRFKQGEIKN